ncbi:MAG: HAD family hydrolase [Sphingomicrobium sp.]
MDRRSHSPMTIKAILFDIDGTLVDSNEQHIRSWIDAFRTLGHEFDHATVHAQIGKGGDNLVPSLLPDVTDEEKKQLSDAAGEAFKLRYRSQVRPFRGARELIHRAYQDGKLIVLASSASREELDYWVELLDVAPRLTATTSRDEVQHSKPAPDIFLAALDKVAPVQPHEAVVIGDTPYDLSAARKNAIPAIAVRSGGFPDDVMRSLHPVAIYDHVQALLAAYESSPLAEAALTPP